MRRDGACFTPSRRQWEFENWWMDEEDAIHRMDGSSGAARAGPAMGKRARTQSSLPGPMARWHHGTLCHPMPHAWTMDQVSV